MPKFQPALGMPKIPTSSWARSSLLRRNKGAQLLQELPPSLSKACEVNKRGSHCTKSNPTFWADDPEDGSPVSVKRQWSKLRAPVWLGFEASDAAAAPLGGGEPGSRPLTNLPTTKKTPIKSLAFQHCQKLPDFVNPVPALTAVVP